MFDCILHRNEKCKAMKRKERSDEIDSQIREDSIRRKRRSGPWKEWRVVVLGAEGSGRSTIFKQMRIMHQGGYSEEERRMYRSDIFQHVLRSVEDVLSVIHELGLAYAEEDPLVKYVSEHSPTEDPASLSSELVSGTDRFWHDQLVKSVVEQHGSWGDHFEDNGHHFLSQITRIGSPDYVPTDQDILLARTSKTGTIMETTFSIEEQPIYLYALVRNNSLLYRNSPLDFFDSMTSAIFCVSLSDYDKVKGGGEAEKQNRLADSLALWKGIVNSPLFYPCCLILFLNKLDVFRRKLPKVPLEAYFPDYIGGNDVTKAATYILDEFKRASQTRRTVVYPQ
ncbi:hypothetical protein D9758_005794 [Tetrapyrgos nigripes]|uniref:Uncharacterized protein n=1 Tax=Tetrapyrgos nigripes TaxID=182062 RepID=A0A8H5GJT7_9AGAR|nr:hypothetical protein D9758_005794 [Tetrapyrgos nigripes]